MEDLTLVTDRERRYGKVLFEICHELLRTGKVGRLQKTLKKGVVVRVKNKGSQAHKKGRKKPKYQTTCPLHPEVSISKPVPRQYKALVDDIVGFYLHAADGYTYNF